MRPPDDLRLRLVTAFLAIACLSQLQSVAVAASVLGIIALTISLARALPWRRLLHVEGFLLLLFATLPFTMAGTPLFSFGPLTASVEGAWRAALIGAKVSASVLMLMALLGDVELSRLGPALRGLRLPERLTRLFVMTVRYLGLLRAEAMRLHQAMRARGFRPRSNRHTWRSYGNLIGMVLVRALDRGRRVEEAMRCRGFDGHFPYRSLPAPCVADWARSGVIAGGFIAALMLDLR